MTVKQNETISPTAIPQTARNAATGIFSIINTESKKIEDTLEICSKHKETAGTPEFPIPRQYPWIQFLTPTKGRTRTASLRHGTQSGSWRNTEQISSAYQNTKKEKMIQRHSVRTIVIRSTRRAASMFPAAFFSAVILESAIWNPWKQTAKPRR